MPRSFANTTVPGLFAQETDKEAQGQLFHLITLGPVTGEDGTTFPGMQLVDANYDIKYSYIASPESGLYMKFPLKFSGVSISTDGTIDKASITVANVSRTLTRELEVYDGLAGCRVSVITVYEKFLDELYSFDEKGALLHPVNTLVSAPERASSHIRDEYLIDSYVANEQTITFQLNALVDFEIRVPRRRFTPFSCYWRYKGDECGFTSAYGTTAGKTNQIGEIDVPTSFAEWSLPALTVIDIISSVGTTVSTITSVENRSGITVLVVNPPAPASTSVQVGKSGQFAECNKSLQDCQERGNSKRFGGFPGVPETVRKIWL